uniref:HTH La-type RNA-binding domain-containing protein n=1 Tax=Panagrellus redivivus TaxID=6233 RepID=A0A7E4ZTN3_PANRE
MSEDGFVNIHIENSSEVLEIEPTSDGTILYEDISVLVDRPVKALIFRRDAVTRFIRLQGQGFRQPSTGWSSGTITALCQFGQQKTSPFFEMLKPDDDLKTVEQSKTTDCIDMLPAFAVSEGHVSPFGNGGGGKRSIPVTMEVEAVPSKRVAFSFGTSSTDSLTSAIEQPVTAALSCHSTSVVENRCQKAIGNEPLTCQTDADLPSDEHPEDPSNQANGDGDDVHSVGRVTTLDDATSGSGGHSAELDKDKASTNGIEIGSNDVTMASSDEFCSLNPLQPGVSTDKQAKKATVDNTDVVPVTDETSLKIGTEVITSDNTVDTTVCTDADSTVAGADGVDQTKDTDHQSPEVITIDDTTEGAETSNPNLNATSDQPDKPPNDDDDICINAEKDQRSTNNDTRDSSVEIIATIEAPTTSQKPKSPAKPSSEAAASSKPSSSKYVSVQLSYTQPPAVMPPALNHTNNYWLTVYNLPVLSDVCKLPMFSFYSNIYTTNFQLFFHYQTQILRTFEPFAHVFKGEVWRIDKLMFLHLNIVTLKKQIANVTGPFTKAFVASVQCLFTQPLRGDFVSDLIAVLRQIVLVNGIYVFKYPLYIQF